MGQIIPAFSRETREAIHAHGVRSDPRRYGPPTGCSHFFQSTIPGWGATRKAIQGTMRAIISIHAPRVGSDRAAHLALGVHVEFLSTLPAWGATGSLTPSPPPGDISIHAPRVGSDRTERIEDGTVTEISIHAPRVGSDLKFIENKQEANKFLSTLPAWGATGAGAYLRWPVPHFYPRSPRGERPVEIH